MSIQAAKVLLAEQRKYLFKCRFNDAEKNILIDRAKKCRQDLRLFAISCNHNEKLQCVNLLLLLGTYQQLLEDTVVRGAGVVPRNNVSWEEIETAFQGRLKTGAIVNLQHLNLREFLADANEEFAARIDDVLARENSVKVNCVLEGEYRIVKDGEEVLESKSFYTRNAVIMQTTDLNAWFNENVRDPLLVKVEEFQGQNSGWTLHRYVSLNVYINKYNPMRGSRHIELPGPIEKRRACINVRNENDEECFKWAVLSALYPAKSNSSRVRSYSVHAGKLNWDNLIFPVTPGQINLFEDANDISVNVFILQYRKGTYTVAPFRVSTMKNEARRHVNLLLIQNHYYDEDEPIKQVEEETTVNEPFRFHYVWIKDLPKLLSPQLSKHQHKIFVCDRCLHFFHSKDKLTAHEVDCANLDVCRLVLPTPEKNILKFKNFKYQEKVPFVVYADFECLLIPQEEEEEEEEMSSSNTKVTQIHEACSVGYYVKCSFNDDLSFYECYRGREPAAWFAGKLSELGERINDMLRNPVSMNPLTSEERETFRTTDICHICGNYLGNNRVRDHCHLTGKYRGAAHQHCNILYQDSHTIPIFFHNMSRYDGHIIIKDVATKIEGRIDLLAQNMENYISFTKYIRGTNVNLRFLDSYRFMQSSIDTLAANLLEKKTLERELSHLSQQQLQLLSRKGVFPYEFLDSWEKLQHPDLPQREDFYSRLNGAHITEADYS